MQADFSEKPLDDLAIGKTLKNRQEYALSCFSRAQALMLRGKFDRAEQLIAQYRLYIDYSLFEKNDNRKSDKPDISLIVVTHNSRGILDQCLASIMSTVDERSEVIIVDNGGNDSFIGEIFNMHLLYIKCPINLYPSEARNVGVSHAIGRIVAFVDDDAIVAKNFVQSIRDAFDSRDIVGLRGRILPRTSSPFNKNIGHYDLGNNYILAMLNTEGNAAILRRIYEEIGGMNPLLFCHEGIEISYRIHKRYGFEKMIYCPETIIHHDYADSQAKLIAKQKRARLMHRYLMRIPGMKQYLKQMENLIKEQIGHDS